MSNILLCPLSSINGTIDVEFISKLGMLTFLQRKEKASQTIVEFCYHGDIDNVICEDLKIF